MSRIKIVVVFVLAIISSTSALTAPYLIGATYKISFNTAVMTVSWRNNDINATGYIVYRSQNDTTFTCVDTIKDYNVTTCKDSTIFLGCTITYKIRAINGTEQSDFSNLFSFKTDTVWKNPGLKIDFERVKKRIKVTYEDNASVESKINLMKSSENQQYTISYNKTSTVPNLIGEEVLYDSAIQYNKWYTYKMVIYNQTDSLLSDSISMFTFDPNTLFESPSKSLPNETNGYIGSMPIQYDGKGCMKFGDTIIIVEKNAPANTYSIFNVSDPYHIVFIGYQQSPISNGSIKQMIQLDNNRCFCNPPLLVKYNNGTFTAENDSCWPWPKLGSQCLDCYYSINQVIEYPEYKVAIVDFHKYYSGTNQEKTICINVENDTVNYTNLNYYLSGSNSGIRVYKNYIFIKDEDGTISRSYRVIDINENKQAIYQARYTVMSDNIVGVNTEIRVITNPYYDTLFYFGLPYEIGEYGTSKWFKDTFHHIYFDTIRHVVFFIDSTSIRVEALKVTNTIKPKKIGIPESEVRYNGKNDLVFYNLSGRITKNKQKASNLYIKCDIKSPRRNLKVLSKSQNN